MGRVSGIGMLASKRRVYTWLRLPCRSAPTRQRLSFHRPSNCAPCSSTSHEHLRSVVAQTSPSGIMPRTEVKAGLAEARKASVVCQVAPGQPRREAGCVCAQDGRRRGDGVRSERVPERRDEVRQQLGRSETRRGRLGGGWRVEVGERRPASGRRNSGLRHTST
ncbi:hypothetical protein MPH_06254, partial [Macrophomina phaseolina MS6]